MGNNVFVVSEVKKIANRSNAIRLTDQQILAAGTDPIKIVKMIIMLTKKNRHIAYALQKFDNATCKYIALLIIKDGLPIYRLPISTPIKNPARR